MVSGALKICILALLCSMMVLAQPARITRLISGEKFRLLHGNVNPRARAEFDQGLVNPLFKLNLVSIAFRTSPDQQIALEQLLEEQQDRSSPNYHRWLTPEEYANRFGLASSDIAKVQSWLQSQGFTVGYVARGRNWLNFSGTAGQIAQAFHTNIHRYIVNGETHYANATEPSIPEELESVVLGIGGLDDFHPTSPKLTAPDGEHALVPDDIATIYDVNRLYSQGLDGTGQSLVVAGQSDIDLTDIATFRSGLNLPGNIPEVVLVPDSADPGTTKDEGEADLDIEWTGAVARNAQIIYVNSTHVFSSVLYAISEDLAPVVSYSFGGCEAEQASTVLSIARAIAQEGNAQGITWLASSGDAGSAGCDKAFSGSQASQGLAVNVPASIPEVTAVGGTEFDEATGGYWSDSNSSSGASALSYIPETSWNESGANGLAASGGGLSVIYPQLNWQAGPGLQSWSARAVPDVALSAAAHDGYAVISAGSAEIVAGTSAATPVLAGIITLLNQNENSGGLGNINPNLYRLAQTNIFHDITTGNNVVSCVLGGTDCATGSFGYYAGPGYDPVTGLGSIDAYNLITEWSAATPQSKTVLSCTPDPVNEQPPNAQGYSWFFTISLKETAGVATNLTGFTVNEEDDTAQIVNYFGSSTIPASGMISATLGFQSLTVPTSVAFAFTGIDAGGRQWSQQISVPFAGPPQSASPPPSVSSVVNGASYQSGISVGALATLFGTNLSPVLGIASPGGATSYDNVSVTVGGRLAPLFTVANVNGQEQINFQVPAELPAGATEAVLVNNNGSIGAMNAVIDSIQPGIFEYVP
ncbi:MAG: S8 family serine peptidase, partial [Bryobacterales bacterium]|nr:S8 family serine peptidase [Bryobacterales bacterium]